MAFMRSCDRCGTTTDKTTKGKGMSRPPNWCGIRVTARVASRHYQGEEVAWTTESEDYELCDVCAIALRSWIEKSGR